MLPRIVFPIAQSFHSVVRPLRVAHSMLANAGELAVRGLWAGAVQPQGESLRVQSLHTPPCCTHRPPPKDDLPWMRNPPTHTPLATLAHSSVHTAARASHRPTDLVRAVAIDLERSPRTESRACTPSSTRRARSRPTGWACLRAARAFVCLRAVGHA